MIEHVMPLCRTIPWVYSVAMLCVFQVCVHDKHVMPLCLTISWVYSVAMLCVFQVCVHDRTCHAALSDNLMGVQCCYALCVSGLCS